MEKRKIAILGGGMAGLSAAYQLSRTDELRGAYDVTVYQMGWRLGGKGASGRDELGRNLEHGLHVWFGFYENTFKLLQEIYEQRPPIKGGWAMPHWHDAVKPQAFTPLGLENADGEWSYWPLTWAANKGIPGSGGLFPTLFELLGMMADWIKLIISRHEGPHSENASDWDEANGLHPFDALDKVAQNLRELAEPIEGSLHTLAHGAIELIEHAFAGHARISPAPKLAESGNTYRSIPHDLFDIFKATSKGIITDLILRDAPFISLDHMEFRDWLLSHGANADVVTKSTIVRLLYDTAFQYEDGDAARPNVAAGTALGTIMRIIATYKGMCIWEVQAGMGEVMVGPLYEQLVTNGVKFEFFNKVSGFDVADDIPKGVAAPVESVKIDVQADVLSGTYQPTQRRDGMVQWPSQPYWDQLANGSAMQSAGVNFESHWCNHPPAKTRILKRGEDFDDIVLAIALGALKQLNSEEPSICANLTPRDADFANWIDKIAIVPTLSVQLWSNKTTHELGWTQAKPACVSGPEYLDIWADMTQVLAFEPWPEPAPKSLHYMTGTLPTTLYRAPASATGTPEQGLSVVRAETITWLDTQSYASWPAAQRGAQFDWSILYAPDDALGEQRLDHQYLRINIDPTECTTLSGAGTTQYRLHAKTAFPNLYLAGEGTAMGLVTSFEGSIMSGAAASRAICGKPVEIIGYDFLERRPSKGFG